MGQGRVELPTSRLSGVRSNHLSYWPGSHIDPPTRTPTRRSGSLTVQEVRLAPPSLASARSLRRLDALARLPMMERDFSRHQLGPWKLVRTCHDLKSWLDPFQKPHECGLLRKEVIQPQVPLRLPCYDFTPVTVHSLGTCLPYGLAQPLLEQTTPMV